MEWVQFRNTSYQVSNTGQVKNKHGRIIKPCAPNNFFKYKSYVLAVDGKPVNVFEHRAVAECFMPNPECKEQINHKDGNKLNNAVENLEWVTRSENIQHMYDTGLKTYKPLHYKGKFGKDHNRSIPVRVKETGQVFGSQSEAARVLKIDHTSVSWSIKHGKPIYGMHFEIGL